MLFQEHPDVDWLLFKSRQPTQQSKSEEQVYLDQYADPSLNDAIEINDTEHTPVDWLLIVQIVLIIINIITLCVIGSQLGKVTRQSKEIKQQIEQTQATTEDISFSTSDVTYVKCPRCNESAISLTIGEDTYIICPNCEYKICEESK